MEISRRIGAGRLSELFGRGQVDTDRYIRTLGWRVAAQRDLDAMSVQSKAILQAYSDGVNAWIDEHKGRLSTPFVFAAVRRRRLRHRRHRPGAVDAARHHDLAEGPGVVARRERRLGDLPAARGCPARRPGEDRRALPGLRRRARRSSRRATPWATAARYRPRPGPPERLARPAATGIAARSRALAPTQRRSRPGPASRGHRRNRRLRQRRRPRGRSRRRLERLGRLRRQDGQRQADPRQRPASRLRDAVRLDHQRPPLPDARNGLPVGRRRRLVPGRARGRARPQRADRLGCHERQPRHAGPVPGDRRPGRPDPLPLPGRLGTVRRPPRDDQGRRRATVEFDVRSTRHGAVLSDVDERLEDGPVLAMRWTTTAEVDLALETFFKIDLATSFDEYHAAFDGYGSPSQNFIYADVDGNIGYVLPGLIPVRAGAGGRARPRRRIRGQRMDRLHPARGAAVAAQSGVRPDRQRQQRAGRRQLSALDRQRVRPRLPGGADHGAARRARGGRRHDRGHAPDPDGHLPRAGRQGRARCSSGSSRRRRPPDGRALWTSLTRWDHQCTSTRPAAPRTPRSSSGCCARSSTTSSGRSRASTSGPRCRGRR